MANEPERPIETLLRAAAKKRRDEAGAPFELHPANRRLLQGEVARQFAQPLRESGSFSQVLRQLWPRFAWGVAILAVLGVAARLLLPVAGNGKQQSLLAKAPSPPTSTAAATPAPAPAPVVQTEPATLAYAAKAQSARANPARQLGAGQQPLAQDDTTALNKREAGEKLDLAAAPQLAQEQKPAEMQSAAAGGAPAQATAGAVNGAAAFRRRFGANPAPAASLPATPAATPSIAMTPPAASAVAATESAQLTGGKSDLSAAQYKALGSVASANRVGQSPIAMEGLSKSAADALEETRAFGAAQQFVQVVPEAKDKLSLADKAPPRQPVLASFKVEQAGQELRIVDSDGSVYSGSLLAAEPARRARSVQAEAPAAARALRAPGGVLEDRAALTSNSDLRAPSTYAFRVAGTNRSLNENVVFTGKLLSLTNAALSLPASTNLGTGGRLGGFQTAPAQPGFPPPHYSRISGKVVIGTDKGVEIIALPARP